MKELFLKLFVNSEGFKRKVSVWLSIAASIALAAGYREISEGLLLAAGFFGATGITHAKLQGK